MYQPNSNPNIDAFLALALRRPTPWAEAIRQLNGLAMFDMLPALQILCNRDRAIFDGLGAQLRGGDPRASERMLWAFNVVADNRLPPAVGDLAATGQVADGERFLARRAAAERNEGFAELLPRITCGRSQDMDIIRNSIAGGTTTIGSTEVRLNPDILALICNVARVHGSVRVLSLYRANHKFHGKVRDGVMWAEAVDISASGNMRVNLVIRAGETLSDTQKSSTLEAVVRVIDVLHAPTDPGGGSTRWYWRFGLPRAGVPFQDKRADEDIFYQVESDADMYRTRPLSQLQDYTRTRIVNAMNAAGSRTGRGSVGNLIISHFADSPDHLHVSVSRQGDP